MVMEAKGVDIRRLSEAQQATFFQMINTEPSACGKPHSLARSVNEDASCRDSLIVAQFIADRLAAGASASDIREDVQAVLEALESKKIAIAGRPSYGNERAPVAIVVFSDFQCPFCAQESPRLRRIVDQFHGRAKLVFKQFPISSHPRSKAAAIAAEAAHEQGKFWQMHDVLFANATELDDDSIYRYARQIGLDMRRFKQSYEGEKAKAAVERDRAEGDRLGIPGTPTIFVNGREINGLLFDGTINGWIDDALKR
jgi:protein-disulfide isomerase